LSCRQSQKIPENFDYGKTENGVYTNKYFDMEVPVPDKWVVQNKEQTEALIQKDNEAIEKSNKELTPQIKTGKVRSATLLAVFKNRTDSLTSEFNASILIRAENLGTIPGIKTGVDYLAQVEKLMRKARMGYQITPGFTSKKIGGKEFDVLRVTRNEGEVRDIKQLYHATIDKGFALAIIISFDTDQQAEELHDILHNIKFR
jgi:hypothetical protein